eukprot:scaffold331493_cov41-Prasinocladus_malaysianus.AAC.1
MQTECTDEADSVVQALMASNAAGPWSKAQPCLQSGMDLLLGDVEPDFCLPDPPNCADGSINDLSARAFDISASFAPSEFQTSLQSAVFANIVIPDTASLPAPLYSVDNAPDLIDGLPDLIDWGGEPLGPAVSMHHPPLSSQEEAILVANPGYWHSSYVQGIIKPDGDLETELLQDTDCFSTTWPGALPAVTRMREEGRSDDDIIGELKKLLVGSVAAVQQKKEFKDWIGPQIGVGICLRPSDPTQCGMLVVIPEADRNIPGFVNHAISIG